MVAHNYTRSLKKEDQLCFIAGCCLEKMGGGQETTNKSWKNLHYNVWSIIQRRWTIASLLVLTLLWRGTPPPCSPSEWDNPRHTRMGNRCCGSNEKGIHSLLRFTGSRLVELFRKEQEVWPFGGGMPLRVDFEFSKAQARPSLSLYLPPAWSSRCKALSFCC